MGAAGKKKKSLKDLSVFCRLLLVGGRKRD